MSPDVGKNALGQLRQNQIFFDNREPAGLHGANCEIRRDIVQAFARDMNKKVTMMMFLLVIDRRLRAQGESGARQRTSKML